MKVDSTEGFEELCHDLSSAFLGISNWQWDEVFNVALCEIKIEDSQSVIDALDTFFKESWTDSTVVQASDLVQLVCIRLGGLREGQRLHAYNCDEDLVIFGAWWPWSDGETISLRISLFSSYSLKSIECLGILKRHFITE
jgi:hypothetical protein